MASSSLLKRWKTALAIALIVALSSEAYFNYAVNDFRVSPSVILFPVLLVSLGAEIRIVPVAIVTSALVFFNRFIIQMISGADAGMAVRGIFPGALFYIVYGCIFYVLEGDRFTATVARTAAAATISALISNIIEVLMREQMIGALGMTEKTLIELSLIAVVRGAFVAMILLIIKWYHLLLVHEEHEERYRRLFMLTTGLKGEIYLMKKNTEQVESVMGDAYKLYEDLKDRDLPDEMKKRSLDIARQVHEIKKDYLRIIQGIEEEIGKNPEKTDMKFSDLADLLLQTARTTIANKKLDITVHCQTLDDFYVSEHYSLMSILNNLVNNAIEAIETTGHSGHILITEELNDQNLVITVHDDGPGISERHLKNIFQMGYSTKFDQKTGNIFRGVGLSGVKNQVEEHFGGSIQVESEVGRYTQFTVTIPREKIVSGKDG